MRLADRYDVICAGGGLSSYFCAALLARAGRKVLVIDDETLAQPLFYDEGYVFDPDLPVFTGIAESSALGMSLQELGITVQFETSDELIQALTPDYRLVFSRQRKRTRDEILREITSGAEGVSDYFDLLGRAGTEIPTFVEAAMTETQGRPKDVAKWRRFWGPYYSGIQGIKAIPLADRLRSDVADHCQTLSAALLGAVSYSSPENLGFEQSMRGLALLLQGQGYFPGGLSALKSQLARIVLDAGGGLRRGTTVESLITEGKRVDGVLLSSFEGIIRAGTVVVGSRLRRLYYSLPENMREPSTLRSLNRVAPSSWRFTISVTVRKDVIPIGASSRMTLVNSYQFPLQEENYLKIQIIPNGLYPGTASNETVTMLITSLVPYRASSMDYSYLRRLGGKMVREVAEVMPYLDENIVALYPDFRESDLQLREAYPFDGSDWVPENLIQYYIRGHKLAQDFWGPPWTSSHPDLYFAGRSIWPSLGIYGEVLTARKIFDDVMLPRN